MARPGSDRLIFPLDVASLELALPWVERLRGSVGVFKVGLELFSAAGPEAVRAVRAAGGANVFLDAKLHDIPATVEGAARATRGRARDAHCARVRRQGHARGGRARREPDTRVLGVTRLTSLHAWSTRSVSSRGSRARPAAAAWSAPGAEAAAVRQAVGPSLAIVCPGVHPAGRSGDQARVVTPEARDRAGADYVVCGRPIRDAADPVAAAHAIADEIARALEARRRLSARFERELNRRIPARGLPPVRTRAAGTARATGGSGGPAAGPSSPRRRNGAATGGSRRPRRR
jgi:orotidine-5'-phosphate decarboxylase